MSIRTDFTIDWGASPRVILVDAPSVECTMQDLLDTLRNEEAKTENMDDDSIVSASGLEPLGAGVKVGLTVALLNAVIGFEARAGPTWEECNLSGGNLVAFDIDGISTISPVYPTDYVFIVKTSSSSATTSDLEAIQYASYQNAVWVDVTGSQTGTLYPSGNREHPVNNIPDAVLIGAAKGFSTLKILKDLVLTDGDNVSDFELSGVSHVTTNITIEDGAICERVRINDCKFTGILDGDTEINRCIAENITYVNGHIHNSGLLGTIVLAGNKDAMLANCRTIDQDLPPHIDMGGSGQSLAMPNYSGIVHVSNLSDDAQEIGIGLDAGLVELEDTISAGTIFVAGDGLCNDFSTGTATVELDGLLNKTGIAKAVLDSIA